MFFLEGKKVFKRVCYLVISSLILFSCLSCSGGGTKGLDQNQNSNNSNDTNNNNTPGAVNEDNNDQSDNEAAPLLPKAATPTFTPSDTTVDNNTEITIQTSTTAGTICFTTNGDDPDPDSCNQYNDSTNKPKITATNTTIKAITIASDHRASDAKSVTYYLRAAKATFDPPGDVVPVTATISCTTPSCVIHYTVSTGIGSLPDDPDPNDPTQLYTAPVEVTDSPTIIKAVVTASNYGTSYISSGIYSLTLISPIFQPSGGTLSVGTNQVDIASNLSSSIYYTRSVGTGVAPADPDTNDPSQLYVTGTGITISDSPTIIKATAYREGYVTSSPATTTYRLKVEEPTFSEASGTIEENAAINITSPTSGAVVHYTTNGDDPTITSASTLPITISEPVTIKARAFKDGWITSDPVVTAIYAIKIATPVISPVAGIVEGGASGDKITVSTTTPGATIYYTLDGSTPTETSSVYDPNNKPYITQNSTFTAKAFKSGWINSDAASAKYVVKFFVGGNFSVTGQSFVRIAKLNAVDGSVDTSFTPLTIDKNVYTIVPLNDGSGKILIAGEFLTYGSVTVNGIARLNSDGTLDTTFNQDPSTGLPYSGFGPNGTPGIRTMVVDTNTTIPNPANPGTQIANPNLNKIYVGGWFTSYNGDTNRKYFIRLNSDGSIDDDFNRDPDTEILRAGFSSAVYQISLQSDGNIFAVGAFTQYNSTTRKCIAKINGDGILDTGFDPGVGITNTSGVLAKLLSVAVQEDGKVVIGGDFIQYNGVSRKYLARLNSDGSLDTNFNSAGTLTNNLVYTIAIQDNGKILVGGTLSSSKAYIERINSNGTLDTSFTPGNLYAYVYSIALQGNGKILIGGGFSGTGRKYITRLKDTGAFDTTFTSPLAAASSGSSVGNSLAAGN